MFEDFEMVDIERCGQDAPGAEGRVMHASCRLAGNDFRCADSSIEHEWVHAGDRFGVTCQLNLE